MRPAANTKGWIVARPDGRAVIRVRTRRDRVAETYDRRLLHSLHESVSERNTPPTQPPRLVEQRPYGGGQRTAARRRCSRRLNRRQVGPPRYRNQREQPPERGVFEERVVEEAVHEDRDQGESEPEPQRPLEGAPQPPERERKRRNDEPDEDQQTGQAELGGDDDQGECATRPPSAPCPFRCL